MQRGKFWESVSMEDAVMAERPSMLASEVEYAASGAVKDCERCARMGARRSSSSRRGRARAVSYRKVSKCSHTVNCKNIPLAPHLTFL